MSLDRKITVPFIVAMGAVTISLCAPAANAQVQDSGRMVQSVETRADKCKNQNSKKIAYTFNRGPARIPLRCGTVNWGHKHLVERGRWSTSFKNKINETLWKGYEKSPGVIFRYKPGTGCSPNPRKNFKVVYNKGPLGGRPGGVTPQGVITASVEYTPRSASAC